MVESIALDERALSGKARSSLRAPQGRAQCPSASGRRARPDRSLRRADTPARVEQVRDSARQSVAVRSGLRRYGERALQPSLFALFPGISVS